MENAAEFVSTALQIILCIVLVVVAFRTYRVQRTRGLRLLLYASICYALVRFGWFTYDLAIYSLSLRLPSLRLLPSMAGSFIRVAPFTSLFCCL
jgi:hypothetical protein